MEIIAPIALLLIIVIATAVRAWAWSRGGHTPHGTIKNLVIKSECAPGCPACRNQKLQ